MFGIIGGALLACLAVTWMALRSREFCLDDAYIHLAYAKSLRLGDGFSYNPGDWETGASSPLWVSLLSLLPIEDEPQLPVKLFGAALHVVTAVLSGRLVLAVARHSPRRVTGAALTTALVGLQPELLQGALSGMEVPLAAALGVGCALAVCAARRQARGDFGAIARARLTVVTLSALATWARPECSVLVVALGLLAVPTAAERTAPGAWLTCLAPVMGAGGAMAAWCSYNLGVSGYAFPKT